MDRLNDEIVSNFNCSWHKSYFEKYFPSKFCVKDICTFI